MVLLGNFGTTGVKPGIWAFISIATIGNNRDGGDPHRCKS